MTQQQDVLSDQQIFDHVVEHMAKQGGPSVSARGLCQYRGPSGRSCAVGCLLTDEEANALGNEKSLAEVYSILPLRLRGGCSLAREQLLARLQHTHDDFSGMDGEDYLREWLFAMRRLARDFGLSTAKLDQVQL